MKPFKILIILYALFLCGCSSDEDNRASSSAAELKVLVDKAADGDSTANKKLSFLLDPSYKKNELSKINIESFNINNQKFYYCLIEDPNPVLSRFAIFDSRLRLYLIDESLNGFLAVNKFKLNDKDALILYENFYSLDSINLQRVSIYSMNDTSFNLAFRSFTQMIEGDKVYRQKITAISGKTIETSVINPGKERAGEKDIFIFDNEKKYISERNLFNNLVEQRIKNIDTKYSAPAIFNNASALWSIGINIDEESKLVSREDFSILMGKNWTGISSKKNVKYLNNLPGFKYSNSSLGFEIFIAKIPPSKKAEDFMNISFSNSAQGKYTVRFSEKIKIEDFFIQYFDYRCIGINYILVIKSPQKTYEIFRPIYQTIINSFNMDC